MGQHAIIFHGTGSDPQAIWYPWLAEQLKGKGFDVETPHWPEINQEPIETFLPKILSSHVLTRDTILIGHSAGAALLLAILEKSQVPVKATYLIAGYHTQPNEEDEPVLQKTYNWESIKANCGDAYIINSLVDPYGCDADQGRFIFEKIGGTQIIMNEGHFGDWNQEYPVFPFLDRLIS
ncbi:alpha/beta hydrolase [Saccharospirillum sp. HFRX-1]|uniref:alpha/beta hydrolase n=1 Tax=unclassified Saccharospirillum TaxID=2633430 RepID=UPI003714CD81